MSGASLPRLKCPPPLFAPPYPLVLGFRVPFASLLGSLFFFQASGAPYHHNPLFLISVPPLLVNAPLRAGPADPSLPLLSPHSLRAFRRTSSRCYLRRADAVLLPDGYPPPPAALVSSNALDALLARARNMQRSKRPSSSRVRFLRRPPRSFRRTRSTLGLRARPFTSGAGFHLPSARRARFDEPARRFAYARARFCGARDACPSRFQPCFA